MSATSSPHIPLHLNEHSNSNHVTPTSKRKRLSGRSGFHTPKAFVNNSLLMNSTLQENAEASNQARKRVEKRRSLALQISPAQPRVPDSVEDTSGEFNLSNEQLVNHYKNCMKLSTENKINSKNAFNLHLIDHMGEMLNERYSGTSLNFMEAGGTIFAGAKIYASRVDAVHTEAYRVLNSLGMHSGEKEEGEEGSQSQNSNEATTTTRKRKKRSMILESNRNAICAKELEVNAPSDMLNIADVSSADGQLINNVVKISDGVTLFFHSAAKPKWHQNIFSKLPKDTTTEESEDADCRERESMQDKSGSMFWTMLNQTKINENPNIFDWDDCNTSLPNDSVDTDSDIAMPNHSQNSLGLDDVDNEMMDDIPDDFGDIDDNSTHSNSNVTLQTAHDNDVLNCTVGVDTNNIANMSMSEYSYFKSNALTLMDGPSHWKLKAQRKPTQKINKGVLNETCTQETGKKKRKVFLLDYSGSCCCSNFPQKESVKSKDSKEKWKSPMEERLCKFAASDEILDKMKSNTLSNFNIKPFNALSKEPVDLETEGYNYGNVQDANNFCPAGVEADNYDADEGGGFDLGATMFEATTFPDFTQTMTQQTNYMDMLKSDENLIHQPRKVKIIDIAYAKKAKRIDVRRLKSAMWKCIETTEVVNISTAVTLNEEQNTADITEPNKKADKTPEKVQETKNSAYIHADNFSELYNTLPKLLPSKMNENLSIPLAFTCLLHLANEKKLKLDGTDDMSEVTISVDTDI